MFTDKEFDDKKKQRQFAMASVFNGFTLHCCVAFKKACLIKKRCILSLLLLLFVYVYKQSYLFLGEGLYQKILVFNQGILRQ